MVGWLPGGSAGTSFCNGTEISISVRAMAPAPGFLVCVLPQASRLDVEQLGCGTAEDIGLLILAQRCRGKDRINRMHLPTVGIVAAEHDLACSDLRHQVADGF